MPYDSVRVLLKVYDEKGKLLVSRPFSNREAAEAWVVACNNVKLKTEIFDLPPRI